MRRRGGAALLLGAVALVSACHRAPPPPRTQRLADLYRPANVEGRVAAARARTRTEWRFDGAAAPGRLGWEAGPGVAGLRVSSGRLQGRATDDFPVLHVARKADAEDREVVQEVQVRMRASAPGNVSVSFRSSDTVDLAEAIRQGRGLPWQMHARVAGGPDLQTCTLRPEFFQVTAAEVRHLLLRPIDVEGATFEIESIRVVFRREHLDALPSGLGWQGLAGVHRETLVARAPETLRIPVTLPERAWLDLAVGTVEDAPVTFRVTARSRAGAREQVLMEHTLTTPQRWEELSVDLRRVAGHDVQLGLSLGATERGAIGFWGAPTIRTHARTAAPTAARTGTRPQGVILVWADTLRRDHLGMYGYARPTSPALDRMAREGVLFEDCVGQGTWTKVATPSLLTALYPSTHGVTDFPDRIPASATTLAEVYRQAGYATLSYSSIPFTGRFTNLHQGFEVVHESSSLPDQESSKTARVFVDRLGPWLDAHRDVPFFVFLHVSDPHDPYRPYAPYDRVFADPVWREEHEKHAAAARKVIRDPLLKLFGMPTAAELKEAGVDPATYVARDTDWYDGSILAMDAEMARLRERLRTLGLEGRVLLAFAADHGEEFLEHGRTFHGQSTYGELSNVPLFLWQPGALPARRVTQTVQMIDVMPTLLALSGLTTPAEAQGTSLLPLIAPEERAVRAAGPGDRAIVERASTRDPGAPPPHDASSVALVLDGWKLVRNDHPKAGESAFELYDHRADPLDRKDLAAAYPQRVERMTRELLAWEKMARGARLKADADGGAALSPEERERLQSLGYVQ